MRKAAALPGSRSERENEEMGIRVAKIELKSSFAFLAGTASAIKSRESAGEAFDLTIHHNRLHERL